MCRTQLEICGAMKMKRKKNNPWAAIRNDWGQVKPYIQIHEDKHKKRPKHKKRQEGARMNKCLYCDSADRCEYLSTEEICEYCVKGPCPHEASNSTSGEAYEKID